jgi:hypothetical protein
MALARLQEGSEDLEKCGHEYGTFADPKEDARLVRRFMNAERREIIILRRYVLLAASTLDESAAAESFASLVSEMREAAKPKRESKR